MCPLGTKDCPLVLEAYQIATLKKIWAARTSSQAIHLLPEAEIAKFLSRFARTEAGRPAAVGAPYGFVP